MTAPLPMVRRELRVRARQRATFEVRVGIGALGTLTLFGILLSSDRLSALEGQKLFSALAWLVALFCCLEGLRLTHDTLSRERREGTLGLLFLTDLRGYDVVLGKLAATGWTAVQELVALTPLLALPLLLGGVSAGQAALTGLALLNLLFATLALGLWASARSTEDHRALLLAFAMGAGWWVLPLALESTLQMRWPELGLAVFSLLSSLLSPLTPFFLGMNIVRFETSFYWVSLGLTHLVGWLLLAGVIRQTRRAWRETDAPFQPVPARRFRRFRDCPPETPPLAWLFNRDARRVRQGWIAALLLELPLFTAFLLNGPGVGSSYGAMARAVNLGNDASFFIATLLLAALVCRPLVELRQTGLADGLLATPLAAREFQEACWAALRKPVLRPVLILLAVETGAQAAGGSPFEGDDWEAVGVNFTLSVVWLLTLCQVGLRLALTHRKPARAALYTVIWTSVIPFAGLIFLPVSWLTILFSVLSPSRFENACFLLLLLYWLLLWWWARIPLWPTFRRLASQPAITRGQAR